MCARACVFTVTLVTKVIILTEVARHSLKIGACLDEVFGSTHLDYCMTRV